jgi:3-deoxy-D-manno-octulosonic-acid transferase
MRVPPGAAWIHGASVGEILAACRLVDRLRQAGQNVFTSTFTTSGRDVMRRTRPEVPCQLAPLDHPWCVEAALDRVQPSVLVLIEAELWPNWIAAARRRAIPVVLVSGRISDRSFGRYRKLRWLTRPTLGRLTAIGARTAADGERLRYLGADPQAVTVTGDLKIDSQTERRPDRFGSSGTWAQGPVIVAGSTHPGEESAALEALAVLERAGLGASLVLAPRHIDRAPEVMRLIECEGRVARLRSTIGAAQLGRGEVLVLDTVGELASLYESADVAFVGGSLVPVGGHNVLEPVLAGRLVLYGPHTDNVRHAVEVVEECGAGRRVPAAGQLGAAFIDVLSNAESSRVAAERGRRALEKHHGTSERTSALIERVLAASERLSS